MENLKRKHFVEKGKTIRRRRGWRGRREGKEMVGWTDGTSFVYSFVYVLSLGAHCNACIHSWALSQSLCAANKLSLFLVELAEESMLFTIPG
jgi:hypothetical protein